MNTCQTIAQARSLPGIWTILFASIAALGIYYSVILVIRGRGKGGRRMMMALYTLVTSLLLVYFVAILYGEGSTSRWIFLTGFMALYLIGPFSYRMTIEIWNSRNAFRKVIPIIPALLVAVFLELDLFHVSFLFALGNLYTIICLVSQAIHLRRMELNTGIGLWELWYTAIQILLFTGMGISSLTLSAWSFAVIASAGLAILILLTWFRLLYLAYLSYVISRS